MKKPTDKSEFPEGFMCSRGEQCRILGYCLRDKELEKQRELLELERKRTYQMGDAFIARWVPQDVPIHVSYHLGEYSHIHLQTAFDAYHGQDYETAILHCKAVIDANCNCGIAYICIVASEYFSGNYEEATYYATRAEEHYDNPKAWEVLRSFNLHCVNLIREKGEAEAKAEEIITDEEEKVVESILQLSQE